MNKDLDHKIVFSPAWDRTDPDPKKNYGVQDVVIFFLVIGEKGITEFQLSTGWHLSVVEDRREKWYLEHWWNHKSASRDLWRLSFPVDVCRWSKTKLSEDDIEMSGISRVFDGGICYYGYRYENPSPEDVYQALVTKGDDGVWNILEKYYCEEFGC